MNAQAALECRALCKSYGAGAQRVAVLKGVELRAARGESVAVVGVSGSGKSTLLHLLGGLDAADAGEVLIGGESLAAMSRAARDRLRNRDLGFVYQFHHLLHDFTVLENVLMPLLIRGDRARAARARGLALLDKVGLHHRAGHKPHQLSGGERQRAAVCRALITRPAVVLADEPTGQLDRATAEQVTGEMLELNRDHDCTLVFATHDERLAARLGRVHRLEDGRLTPGERESSTTSGRVAFGV